MKTIYNFNAHNVFFFTNKRNIVIVCRGEYAYTMRILCYTSIFYCRHLYATIFSFDPWYLYIRILCSVRVIFPIVPKRILCAARAITFRIYRMTKITQSTSPTRPGGPGTRSFQPLLVSSVHIL